MSFLKPLKSIHVLTIGVSIGASISALLYWIRRNKISHLNMAEELDSNSVQKLVHVVNSTEFLLYLLKNRKNTNNAMFNKFFQEELEDVLKECRFIVKHYKSGYESDDSTTSDSTNYVTANEILSSDEGDLFALLSDNIYKAYPLYYDALITLKDMPSLIVDKSSYVVQVDCSCNVDYLAKVICIRKGFDNMMNDVPMRDKLIEISKSVGLELMNLSHYNADVFINAFQDFMTFAFDQNNLKNILDELKDLDYDCLNIYDIIIENMILYNMQDLSTIPSLEVIRTNTWISNSFKKKAFESAIWAVHAHKARYMKDQNGLLTRFITLSQNILPAVAWGLYGSENDLNKKYWLFTNVLLKLCIDMFSFDKVRYLTTDTLCEDIFKLICEFHISLLNLVQSPKQA